MRHGKTASERGHGSGEKGYILLAILFALTLLIISLAAAAPSIATSIKREREIELQHRGKQYTRAIQLYFRKFGRYPNSLEQLENTNNLRFLRKKYADPLTGKDDWKLIRLGQAHPKARPAYLKGATPAGAMAGATPAASMGGTPTGQSGFSSGSGFQVGNGPAGSRTGLLSGSSSMGGAGSGPGAGQSGSGITGAVNASDISKPLGGNSTAGSLPIVGVASISEKDSLKEMDGKTKYSEWEFTYDPTFDPTRGAAGIPQQPGIRGTRPGRQ